MNAKDATSFLISSHNLVVLYLVATHFGIMNEGRIVTELSHRELLWKYVKILL